MLAAELIPKPPAGARVEAGQDGIKVGLILPSAVLGFEKAAAPQERGMGLHRTSA